MTIWLLVLFAFRRSNKFHENSTTSFNITSGIMDTMGNGLMIAHQNIVRLLQCRPFIPICICSSFGWGVVLFLERAIFRFGRRQWNGTLVGCQHPCAYQMCQGSRNTSHLTTTSNHGFRNKEVDITNNVMPHDGTSTVRFF